MLRFVVSLAVSVSHFGDAFQEARLAVLKVPPGYTESWYIQRGVWAALNRVRRERKTPLPVDAQILVERVANTEPPSAIHALLPHDGSATVVPDP